MSLKRTSRKIRIVLLVAVAAMVVAGVVIVNWRHQHPRSGGQDEASALAGKKSTPTNNAAFTNSATVSSVPSALELSRRQALYASFQKKPFAVTQETGAFGWTAEDGKDPGVIKQLAHNELEFQRMVEENSRIFRRQLVYLKETAASVFEQAKLTGKPVQQLTLPGVDGQELRFEIVKSDSKSSSRQGMFSGHLVGNTDSLVTLAFEDGRQAFTILSPKENIFIVGEPREDGQVIVKAIDPNTYGVGPAEADDTVKTQPTNK
jgi:hypothetical protein